MVTIDDLLHDSEAEELDAASVVAVREALDAHEAKVASVLANLRALGIAALAGLSAGVLSALGGPAGAALSPLAQKLVTQGLEKLTEAAQKKVATI